MLYNSRIYCVGMVVHDVHVYILLPDNRKVYATVVDKADHLYRLEGGDYDDAEFEAYPDRYGSIFADQVHMAERYTVR